MLVTPLYHLSLSTISVYTIVHGFILGTRQESICKCSKRKGNEVTNTIYVNNISNSTIHYEAARPGTILNSKLN